MSVGAVGGWLRSILVVVEVAAAVVLLIGAGLMLVFASLSFAQDRLSHHVDRISGFHKICHLVNSVNPVYGF